MVSFPKRHDTDVIGLGFACTGRFVMTCSDKTTLVLWSIRGEELAAVDTYHMSTYCAKISPCGRFVASSGEFYSVYRGDRVTASFQIYVSYEVVL